MKAKKSRPKAANSQTVSNIPDDLLPIAGIAGRLGIRTNSEATLQIGIDTLLLRLDMGLTQNAREALTEAAQEYVIDVCMRALAYGWLEYRAHFEKTLKTGELFLNLLGHQHPPADRHKLASKERGAALILRRASPDNSQLMEGVETLVNNVRGLLVHARDQIQRGPHSHQLVHTLIRELNKSVYLQIDQRLPQKSDAATGDFNSEEYPLFALVRGILDFTTQAASSFLNSLEIDKKKKAAATRFVSRLKLTNRPLVDALLKSRRSVRRELRRKFH